MQSTYTKLNIIGSAIASILAIIISLTYGIAASGSGEAFSLFVIMLLILGLISLFLSIVSGVLSSLVMTIILFYTFFGGSNGGMADSVQGIKTVSEQSAYLKTQRSQHHTGYISYGSKSEFVRAVKHRIKESWINYDVYVGDGKYNEAKFEVEWKNFQQWFLTHDWRTEEPPLPKYLGDADEIKMLAR